MDDRRAKSGHTPGPWNYKPCDCSDPLCPSYIIDQVPYGRVSLADARLIAAAPEMLQALECIAEHSLKNIPSEWNDKLQDFVSTALRIAKGKA